MIFKTVQCIIKSDAEYLLAIHNNTRPETTDQTTGKWGLVGGQIEQGELFEITAIREVYEELNLRLERLTEVADYSYDDALHKVFGIDYKGSRKITFDPNEILDLHWFSFEEVNELEKDNNLHTGFEFEAIKAFEALALAHPCSVENQSASAGFYP